MRDSRREIHINVDSGSQRKNVYRHDQPDKRQDRRHDQRGSRFSRTDWLVPASRARMYAR